MTATTSAPPLDPQSAPHDTPHSNAPRPDPAGNDVDTELARALHRQFLEHAAITNWSSWRLMVLIRKMEACQGYRAYSCKTLTDYLVLMCGIGHIAARQRIRVAEGLAELPAIEAEFAAGPGSPMPRCVHSSGLRLARPTGSGQTGAGTSPRMNSKQ